ncbi:Bacterial regulatory protein, tetR family [Actinomadura rubteroloni]|uniref:Bacterial regulatory protein, tetR family n=1 Tax=Actinomadura rubteroloni TaxID=1926885 RepID=A0A2P4UFZ6_9ACTN|nr:TetR/AcrR family transcriptional regulator [Actinomadura rubteroloni]POM23960.1 Bacterial regulatory protein, tetR family [Actinomadura rubteroloni]
MSGQAENVRTRRTRKLLREALAELIRERGFERTTVSAITERAMVSRAAFYRNYNDKYDLVEKIFAEAVALLTEHLPDEGDVPDERRWVAFFEHFAEYHQIYTALLGDSGSQWFAGRMRATLAEMVTAHLPATAGAVGGGTTGAGLVPTLISALFVQSVAWWLGNGRPVPAAEMADRFSRIAVALVEEVNGWPAP